MNDDPLTPARAQRMRRLHKPIMNPCYGGEHNPEVQRNGEIRCRKCGWYLKTESDDELGNAYLL